MTRRKAGLICVIVGLMLIAASVGLLMHNRNEEKQAATHVEMLAPQIVEVIEERKVEKEAQEAKQREEEADLPMFIRPKKPDPNREMPSAEIDGHEYIGFLAIPVLDLELPIMADWSYPQLRIAPCRYTGSLYLDNLVLMAHNYNKHFGRLDELRVGTHLTFTDMDGLTVEYEVVALDILEPTAIEEMTAGEYDLTLFTCTYGGKSRVTLRCDRIE